MRHLINVVENASNWLDSLSGEEQDELAQEMFAQIVFAATKRRQSIRSCAEFDALTIGQQDAFFPRIVARWEKEGMPRPGTEAFLNWLNSVWRDHGDSFQTPLEDIFPDA